jgi:hypothetical protein
MKVGCGQALVFYPKTRTNFEVGESPHFDAGVFSHMVIQRLTRLEPPTLLAAVRLAEGFTAVN